MTDTTTTTRARPWGGLAPLALLAGLAAAAGCYNPSIKDGGFLCNSTPGKPACPDGFVCGTDHVCRTSATAQSDASVCTSPPVTPVCQDSPPAGHECNPACQTGCECGRCNLVGSVARCTAPGARTLGQVCTLSSDNCAAGLVCLAEACGNVLGRCYQFCNGNAQCNGTICQIVVQDMSGADSSFRACDLAPQDCNPVSNTGCPDPALNCYVTSTSQTLCDCPNVTPPRMSGDSCMLYNDCAAGYVCISGVGGLSGARCYAVCDVGNPACPLGRACIPTSAGSKYGYCA
jgi:hypothetical protein